MNDANHIEQDDLNLFALQLLPDAAMKEFAAHLRDCAECRAQLGEIQGSLMAYAMTAGMRTPPADARDRLLRQVALEKKIVPIDSVGKSIETVNKPFEIIPVEATNHYVAEQDATEEAVEITPVEPVELKTAEPVEAVELKTAEPVDESAEQKAVEPVEQKAAEPVDESAEQKAVEPVEQKAAEPVELKTVESDEQKTVEPVEQKPAEPVELKAVEPVEQKAAEQVEQKASEVEQKAAEVEQKAAEPIKLKPFERTETPAQRLEKHLEPVLYQRNSRMFQMDPPEERKRGVVAPILAWIGWAVAAMAAVAAGVQYQQQKLLQDNLAAETAQLSQNTAQSAQAKRVLQLLTDRNAMQVSLHVPLTKGAAVKLDPEAHATYVPGSGSLVFVASHLDPLLPAKTYELWVLPTDPSQAPIPAGLFKPDLKGNATLVMPDLPKDISAKGFGVTVENEGGSKTPTAPIVLAGM